MKLGRRTRAASSPLASVGADVGEVILYTNGHG